MLYDEAIFETPSVFDPDRYSNNPALMKPDVAFGYGRRYAFEVTVYLVFQQALTCFVQQCLSRKALQRQEFVRYGLGSTCCL